MNKFYTVFIILLLSLPGFSQKMKSVEVTSTLNSKMDTNSAVYDEMGSIVSQTKYVELIYSGYYSTHLSGDPSNPQSKLIVKKLSASERLANVARVGKNMAAKSEQLLLNSTLNLTPFFGKFNEEDFEDKVKILVFWAPECVSCTESFTYLNDVFQQTYKPEKAIILAITTDDDIRAQVKLLQKPLLHAKLISNARMVTKFYNLNSYPTYVIADKDNVIKFAVSGTTPQVISAFKTQLRALLN